MPNNIKEIKDKRQQYNIFLNYSMNDNSDSKLYGRLILSIISVLLLLCFIIFLVALHFKNNPKSSLSDIPFIKRLINKIDVKDDPSLDFGTFNKRQTILILGVDSNGNNTHSIKGTRSDTIILANVDPHTKTINLVSIPRDSKVYLANHKGVDKINAAHALGGIDLTKATIQETFGVKINRYIIVHGPAVREIVDALGGVPTYVEKRMHYNDNAGNLHIDFQPGLQILDGRQAEGYLRFRHDGLGDIGRMSRQQWFLRGLSEKVQQPSTIAKLPELVRVISMNVTTDMSIYELSKFANVAREIKIDNIQVATLPGKPSQKGYISYWILDPEKTQEVIDNMIHRENHVEKYNMVASIMYSYDKEKEATEIKNALQNLGFEVKCMGRAQLPHSQFVAHTSAINTKFVNNLKREIPQLHSMQYVFNPEKTYCNSSDFTIIIAN